MEKREDDQGQEDDGVIAPHFGDIMGKQTFTALPDGFSPIERIVLLANGNLQRVVSAFYNVRFLFYVSLSLSHNGDYHQIKFAHSQK